MYRDMASLGNFHKLWSKNIIFFNFGRMYVVTWTPFGIAYLTTGYLAFLLIVTLGALSVFRGIYPGNMVADPDPDASALWVALNLC